MTNFLTFLVAGGALTCGVLGPANADLRATRVHAAEGRKSQNYIADGLFFGGDAQVQSVVVKDIRRAANSGFERVVIDLEGTKGGEIAQLARPPYFQVAVSPDEKRVVVTLWGNPKLKFDAKKVASAFLKSPMLRDVVLLPKVEDGSWTFAFEMRAGAPVEVFELGNPARIILDVKRNARHPASAQGGARSEAPSKY